MSEIVQPSINLQPHEIQNQRLDSDIIFKARTFEEARLLPKQLGPELTAGVLGREFFLVKSYLDQVPPDNVEIAAAKRPEVLAELHDEASQMIKNNLKIFVPGKSSQERQVLSEIKQKYLADLEAGKGHFKNGIHALQKGGRVTPEFMRAAEYRGLNVKLGNNVYDISDQGEKISGVRPNIKIQREAAGIFVHWETDRYADSRSKKVEPAPELTKRIYLNPRITENISIFTTVMQRLNAEGIVAKGKVADRSFELANDITKDTVDSVRADSIVLYVQEADANLVLTSVMEIYEQNKDSFSGRAAPKIPQKLAPGLGIGDEPESDGESLTSHRADLITLAAYQVRRRHPELQNGIPAGKEEFARVALITEFKQVAIENGVDPHNLAFNLTKAA